MVFRTLRVLGDRIKPPRWSVVIEQMEVYMVYKHQLSDRTRTGCAGVAALCQAAIGGPGTA